MGRRGLALALSVSMAVNLILLAAALRLRLEKLGGRKIAASACQTAVWSAIMGAVVWRVSGYAIPAANSNTGELADRLLVSIFTGLVVYAALSYLSKGAAYEHLINLTRGGATRR